jgi:hypothetical protein
MMTLNDHQPPTVGDLTGLLALVRLLANPQMTAESISKLLNATNAHNAAKADAEKAAAESAKTLADHAAQITAERAAHDAAMADERRRHKQEADKAMGQIRAREEETKRLHAAAQADAQAAAELREGLADRLAKLRVIAA